MTAFNVLYLQSGDGSGHQLIIDAAGQIGINNFPMGQQLAAASVPIVLTAAQLTTLTPRTTVGITGLVNVAGVGAAGAPLGGIMTIQGDPSGTPIPIIGTLTNEDFNLAKVGGTNYALGQQLASLSLPIVLTAAQLTALTPLSTVTVNQGTSPWIISGSFSPTGTQDVNLKQVGGATFALGQQLAAGSLPIVLTAAQIATLTPPAAITNYALETGGNLATLAGGVSSARYQTNIAQVGGANFALGQQLAAASAPVVLTAAQITSLTNPNIAQFGGVNVSLGQKVMASSMPIVIASDQTALPTTSAQSARMPGTITAAQPSANTPVAGATVTVQVSSYSVATITLNGTYAGVTLVFEYSDETGTPTNWYPVIATPASSTNSATAQPTLVNNSTIAYNVTLPGIVQFRVRASAYTSGTLNVAITATADPMVFTLAAGIIGVPNVQGATATNTALSGSPVRIGAAYNTVQPAIGATGRTADLQVTVNSALIVAPGVDGFAVNINQVGGTSFALGQQLAAASLPVVLTAAQIATLTPLTSVAVTQSTTPWVTNITQLGSVNIVSSQLAGTMAVGGAVANGAALSGGTYPLVMAGSDFGGTPIVSQLRINSTGSAYINVNQVGGNGVVTAKAGVMAVGGTDAVNVAPTANPNYIAALGQSSEPAANTTGRLTALMADLYGHLITSPYANRENFVRGNASATNTTSTSCVASAGAGLKNYITSIAVSNSGATTVTVNIQDGSAGTTIYQVIAPAGGGGIYTLPVPIAGSAATAVYFAASGSTTTLLVSMAGYKGA